MPQPYPGQEWRHGWVPVTASAAKSKNHGRKPAKNSLISRMVAEAAEIHQRQQREDAERSAGGQKADVKPDTRKTSPQAKPKQPKKAGEDSRGTVLRDGDEVRLTGGSKQGKNGKVVGKGPGGRVKVEVDGETVTEFPMNLRRRQDHETSKAADDAIRRAAGRPSGNRQQDAPTARLTVGQVQDRIRGAYNELAGQPGEWVSITRLRDKLGTRIPRQQVDDALRRLDLTPNVVIAPEANRKTLSQKDRDAAVIIGEQDKHLIQIT